MVFRSDFEDMKNVTAARRVHSKNLCSIGEIKHSLGKQSKAQHHAGNLRKSKILSSNGA